MVIYTSNIAPEELTIQVYHQQINKHLQPELESYSNQHNPRKT